MMKIKFANSTIFLNGNETTMQITALLCWDKLVCYTKRFTHKITLKDGDKYDLNKAKTILQTKIEIDAYKWALIKIKPIIEETRANLDKLAVLKDKASFIIEHDKDYLKKLK